jgi:tellurite resistance protein TerC
LDDLQAIVLFNVFVLAMLALDLGVFHRRAQVVSFREALVWSVVWLALALAFNVVVYFWRGPQPALEFLNGYVLEKSLSMDNVFLISVIFSSMAVPAAYQHRILFWGVLGALVMRAALIAAGVAVITRFDWILYAFGGLLIFTGVRLFRRRCEPSHPERNPFVRLARRVLPMAEQEEQTTGPSFFIRRGGKLLTTRLLLVVVMVEATDLVLAVDSVPAVFGVTQDPFVVYTSNVFALLGLRSLYFVLAGALSKFRYLHTGLSAILVFVGMKMLLGHAYELPVWLSLLVCATATITVVASLRRPGAVQSRKQTLSSYCS